ncbi:fatty acid metabolism regulator protein [Oxobacter pfennigii]|uniref:Fatty acid metabolism regulator protein n=1 Tax=Oxobacter pfennigii TaxID=36849 RepID=A0A0P8WCK7_9CLOT|nr:TetR/AcrR family transcriptional regulator [Oxobacter pfennigii]KPU45485.1 fatty acid metabolism regulator protein [Oxobacter pfennigii]
MVNEPEKVNQAQKIISAAFKCISVKGYANVSLRDIADEAGVVLSQLNYYYKNKEGLFTEIIKRMAQQYLSEVEEILKKGQSEKERISSLIEYFQRLLRKNPELFKLLFDLTSMALWSASLKELLNDFFNKVANLIEKYIISEFSVKEKFKYSSPVTLSRMMLGALFGTSIQVMLADEKEDMIYSLSTMKVLFE